MTLGKVADTLGIIGFIGAIVAGFWGVVVASQLMLVCAVIYVIAYLAFKVWQLSKENKSLKAALARKTTSIDVRKFFDGSISISSTRKNKQLIAADFIHWDECTMMVWVYVPPRGEGLRDLISRCLFSHTTGHTESWANFNAFILRHSEHNNWHFSFSNGKAKYPQTRVLIDDSLEPGWHHFLLQWNKLLPELKLLIDKGGNGNARSTTYLSYWPEKNAENLTVGSWETGQLDSYCETKLLSLWICNKYLSIDDELVSAHYSLAPA
jgi:hypothetical protein